MPANTKAGKDTQRQPRTTISVDDSTRRRVDSFVGRFGRTQQDVVNAGLDCLVAKIRPLPAEVPT